MKLRRRTVLMLSTAAGLAAALGILTARVQLQSTARLQQAGQDYLAGNLAIADGWIVSAEEAKSIDDSRLKRV